ncbi:MAG: hypothetical protein EOO29_05185 [Comamonadaceae bacterium]|nr:MAG: hypothetical protein EOO29_05185 [Comamonadaceae bacterium]
MTAVAITAIGVEQATLQAIGGMLKRYGLDPVGGPWAPTADDVTKVGWRPLAEAMAERKPALWLIVADAAALEPPHVRYGLSLMAGTLRGLVGTRLPVARLGAGQATLPPLLADALLLEPGASWPAKIVAAVHRARQPDAGERLVVHGNEQLGQWIELAPAQGLWNGLVFGVSGEGASIDFQAVGPRGGLPEKSVLAYAQQNLQLDAGARRFTAWALRNEVGDTPQGAQSYYARVRGQPDALLWMPYTETDDGEATVLPLV